MLRSEQVPQQYSTGARQKSGASASEATPTCAACLFTARGRVVAGEVRHRWARKLGASACGPEQHATNGSSLLPTSWRIAWAVFGILSLSRVHASVRTTVEKTPSLESADALPLFHRRGKCDYQPESA